MGTYVSGMDHVINPSRPSPLLVLLQVTKAGRESLGTRLDVHMMQIINFAYPQQ